MATIRELMERMARGEMEAPPVARLIGFGMESVEDDRVVMTLEVDRTKHANPMGTLHGGILCDVLDAAMGSAWATRLVEGESYTTLELKVNYLRPVWEGELRVVGTVLDGGKTVGLTEGRVFDQEERLIAFATSTLMTLRGEQARGR